MMMIPHSLPSIAAQDHEAVSRVLTSRALAQGRMVEAFEEAVADRIEVAGGVAVSSGTAALHLALLALGIGPGDEVILPSYVCVAPLNAIGNAGATPVLSDIEPETGNIAPPSARYCVTEKTRAIIVPHLFGHPARLAELADLGVPLIEDLAQAIGADYRGRQLGSLGRLAICSFYATKVLTTGEGGMVLSDDLQLLATVRDLRDYDEKVHYRPRFNCKMTEMQAALGLSQLSRLPEFIARRKEIAARYRERLQHLPLLPPPVAADCDPIYYRYVIQPDLPVDEFIEQMDQHGVVCRRPVFRPLHRLLGHTGFASTEQFHNHAVSIPIYPDLTNDQVETVAAAVKQVLNSYWTDMPYKTHPLAP